jgi:hypothetical protein
MNYSPRDSGTVEQEIKDLHGLITGIPPEASNALFLNPYRDRLESLREELFFAKIIEDRERKTTQIHVRLETPENTHTASASIIGSLLNTWQDLIDSLGQAVLGKATTRGIIPLEIRKQTRLDLEAFAPGSFVIRLIPHKANTEQLEAFQETESLISKAFAEFLALTNSVSSPESLSSNLKRVKGRVAQHYGKLLELVRTSNTVLSAALSEPGNSVLQQARVTTKTAADWNNSYKEAEALTRETFEFTGRLTGANLRTGKFELDLGEEGVIAGEVEKGKELLLHDTQIGSRYHAEVAEIGVTNHATDSYSTTYVLLNLEPIPF